MMEANCLEIASLISVILKDALALIRIVNAVRSPPEDKTAVSRIFQNLAKLQLSGRKQVKVEKTRTLL